MSDNNPQHNATAFLTVSEVARRKGISRALVYSEIEAGRLRARKLGRLTVVEPSDLNAWIEALPAFKRSTAA